MAQYRNGTVSVETGSATVHGINTNFVGNVAAGNLFSIVDENVWYEILSVNENGRITLTGNYVGATRGALAYAVQRDFTPHQQLPFPEYGDQNTAGLVQLAFTAIDSALLLMADATTGGTPASQFMIQQDQTGTPTNNAGIVVNRGALPDASILFTDGEIDAKWSFDGFDVGDIGSLDVSGNVVVNGNLTVNGTTVTMNTTTVDVEDPIISVGKGNTGSAPFLGLKAERDATDAFFVWNESTDRWSAYTSNNDLTTRALGAIQAATFYGELVGGATKFTTPRNIAGVAFDGSADIALTSDNISAGSTNLFFTNTRARAALSTEGVLAYNSSTGVLSFTDNASTQKIEVSRSGTLIGTRKRLNFIPGANVTLNVADNPGTDRVDITITSTGEGGGGGPTGGIEASGEVVGGELVLWADDSGLLVASGGAVSPFSLGMLALTIGADYRTAIGAEALANRGVANGYVPLDSGAKIDESYLPAIALVDVSEVDTEGAMLGLTAQKGDVAVRSDINKSFVLKASPATTLANWVELRTPTDVVLSIAGLTGSISATSLKANLALVKADVGLSLVNNTTDLAKPVSTATQAALDDIFNHVDAKQTKGEMTIVNSTVLTYNLVLTDKGGAVERNYASDNTVNIPLDSSVNFPIGSVVTVVQTGAGQTSITATSGVTLTSDNNMVKLKARYVGVTLYKHAANSWRILGGLVE